MKMMFFGLPMAAALLEARGITPVATVLGYTDMPGMRRVRERIFKRRDHLVLARPDLESAEVLRCLESVKPDVILSWFYPRKIPSSILQTATRGAFGVHPSLLPKLRGPDPFHWAIRNGETKTGVTLHRLDSEYDTGEIIAQREVAIHENENAWTLARKLDRPSIALLLDAAEKLSRGENLVGLAQDESAATYAPRIADDDFAIEWHEPTETILRFIRASAPWPGAFAELGDELVTVQKASRAQTKLPRVLEVAEAFICDEGVLVRSSDGAVKLEIVTTENDEELRGHEIAKLFNK